MKWFYVMGFLLGSIITLSFGRNWFIFAEALICFIVLILHVAQIW